MTERTCVEALRVTECLGMRRTQIVVRRNRSVSTIRKWLAGAGPAENVLYNQRLRSA